MKEFMLVYYDPETNETGAEFFDTAGAAEDVRMNMAVSLGWYVEVYQRIVYKDDHNMELGREYRFAYS